MPEFRFYRPIEVRYADLDAQGHVNNAKYLTYFEQARVHYWTEIGLFSKGQSFDEIGVIIADIHIRYRAPVFWGSPVKVGVTTTRIGNKSLTIEQCLVEEPDGRTCAEGTVILVAYDYPGRQAISVPPTWRERIEQYEGRKLA